LQYNNGMIVSCYRLTNGVRTPFEQACGGSGAWYAMELTELLPHIARGLNINWDEATRYAGLNAES
jgi:hypothetical protein